MKVLPFITAIMLCLLLSCSQDSKNMISIKDKNFDEEILPDQNLEFTLTQHVANDSLFDKWIDDELISFEPKIKGRFKFTSSDKLIFSPESPFLESEIFKARLNEAIFKYTDLKLAIDNNYFSFHTPLLDLKNANLYWVKDNASGQLVINADLNFNASVNADDLAKKLLTFYHDQQQPYKILTQGSSKTISVAVYNVSPDKADEFIKFHISRDIGSPQSNYKTTDLMELKADIPFIKDMEIREVSAEHNGMSATIKILTNQQVANANINDLITFTPAVAFKVEKLANGLLITGDEFDPAQTYSISVLDVMYGVAGGKMPDVYTQQITFGEMKPLIQFANSKGKYLSSLGNRNLAVNIVNIPKIKVEITKIYENNILSFMRNGLDEDWYYDYNDNEDYYDYYNYSYINTDLYGTKIFEKEYDTKTLSKFASSRVLNLDFIDRLERFDGFYVLTVSSTEKTWLTESRIVSVSDIGLIAKAGDDEVTVFANSLLSATPLSGIKVSFVSANNQKLYTAVTNKEGVATFTDIKKNFGDFTIGLITVKNESDFNFLPFTETEVSTSRFDVGGKRLNASNMDAFLYAERDLYRPGETINVSGIIRDYEWKTIARIPVKVKLILPSGKEYKSVRKTLNDQGAFETSFDIAKASATGNYTLELYSSTDVLLASKNISVEEFMPDRIKVNASLDKKEYYTGDKIHTSIISDNLFGTPASNRNWECELSLTKKYFSSTQYPDYNFYIANQNYLETKTTEGTTNESGQAVADFDIPATYIDMGILDGRILTTVFDESGRPVYNEQVFNVITQNTLFGIGYFDDYVATRQTVKIPLIAVDKDDKLVSDARAKIDIIRHDWQTVVEKSGQYYSYRSNKTDVLLYSDIQNMHGKSSVSFVPEISGEYEIRIYRPEATAYVSQTFYAYGWGDTRSTSFEVNNEGNINIIADKDSYESGETASLLFTAPFNGRMLVTVERDNVLEYYYLNTDKKTASLHLKMTDKHVPNIYVSATLFRPTDNSALPLTVGHGIINIKVDNPSKKLPLTIAHEKQSRSNKTQTIKIKTLPGAAYTVAIVDEGILQIKNYKTPDPYDWFYMQRALSVGSYDMYAYLYPEIYSKKLLTGGDAALGRTSPVLANRVHLISYWSGIKQADGNGNGKFDIDIPQFSGDLRVMVVAYKNDMFSSSETHMKVSDPIVVTTSLPRFLSPGDTIIVPITLANTTTKNAAGTIAIQVSGPIAVVNNSSSSFSANANKEARSEFKLVATNATGAAKITTKITAFNETYTDVTDIAVRPPASLQKSSGYGSVNANTSSAISFANNYLPEASDATLIVSHSPIIQFAKSLDYLITYPNGCVEQITSSVFPQLYFSDLVKDIYGTENKNINPSYNVQEGIRILQSMQLYNGALSYWPGEGYESWWGSIYACNFLLEAKKAGYETDNSTIEKLCGYMKAMLKEKKTFMYRYNQNLSKEIAPKEVCYSLYVLALAGKAELSTMNYYKANPSLLSLDSKYLLAASYSLAGDTKTFAKILPPQFAGEQSEQILNGSFYSPIRDYAISLNCLLESDANNIQVPVMAKQLSEMIHNANYLNTQENAFAFLALGKIARKTKDSNITASIKANGKTLGEFTGKNLTLHTKDMLNTTMTIDTKGTGQLYYFWMIKGISADGSFKEEDNYMKVRKTFYDRWGHQLTNLKNIKQNDLIVIKITASANSVLDNVVITDMLPAGFEIENDRIRATASLQWIKDQSEADYEDIRDDRINLYTTLTQHPVSYYYTVRAVSPGVYKMGPVMADAMYNELYHSYNGAGWIKINR